MENNKEKPGCAAALILRGQEELGFTNKLMLSLAMACLTGMLAQVRIPLPWTPVPMTGQTFCALLSGVMLGQLWGAASMGIYLAAGVAGVPWFSGATGGIAILAGPTVGYLFGFILTSFFVGWIFLRPQFRAFLPMIGWMAFANLIFIYGCGLLWLSAWLYLAKGTVPTFHGLIAMGVFPFVAGDFLKIILVAAIAKAISRKT